MGKVALSRGVEILSLIGDMSSGVAAAARLLLTFGYGGDGVFI